MRSLRKIHEYSLMYTQANIHEFLLVYTAKVWYSDMKQWHSILVGPAGIGEGPKNPLKGISMKPVVSASYAQSGVDAGGRHFCLRRMGQSQWHGKHGPGRCGDRILCRGVLPLWSATSVRYRTEPALRCYPASSRERCVQCSLPCVSRSGKGKLSVRGPWPWAGGRYSLERLFAKEDKNRKGPLWKSPRLSEMGGSGIAVRLEWQSGSGCGDAPPDVSKGNRLRGDGRFASVENKPDLNRKIYRIHRHCCLWKTLLCEAIG